MSVLTNFISTLFSGILMGVFSTALILTIIKRLTNASVLFITVQGFFIFLFLSFQFSALTGAYKAKQYIQNIVIPTEALDNTHTIESIGKKYPALVPFLKKAELKADKVTDTGTTLYPILCNAIDRYIYRRIGWILCGIIIIFLTSLLPGLSNDKCKRQTRRHSRKRNIISNTHRR